MKTIRIKPRKGVELAGIPAAGADVPEALGQEWLAAKLVTRIDIPRGKVSRETKPAVPATEG